MGQVRAGGQEVLEQGEHRRQDDTGARVNLLWQGWGKEEETIEPGESNYRFKIATNKHYSYNSENDEQKFSKETIHSYNTNPASYEDFNLIPRLRNNLKVNHNQNHLIATHYVLSTNPSQEVRQNKGKRGLAHIRGKESSSGTTSPGR